ncbi:hypothetical protein ABT061_32800 [Streptosporangium sp. NPDC002544]|uniref:hypothetical protein n=1 Tax=Streptosporangium sp. NPDC002544 TaxID=3154538 RepID=UPI00332E9FB7
MALIGLVRVSTDKQKTQRQLREEDAQFEAALALARQIKAHAPHCRVILTVYEMKRLGRRPFRRR